MTSPAEALREKVARRMYEDMHKGLNNCHPWDGDGLDDEHPGARKRWLKNADSAIAALTSPAPALIDLEEAVRALLPWLEDAETKCLVGHEGCVWAVEHIRHALEGKAPAPAPDVAGVVDYLRKRVDDFEKQPERLDQFYDGDDARIDSEAATLLTTLSATNERWQRQCRDGWEAFSAMRSAINEVVPMQSEEADLLTGPEMSMSCEIIAKAVVQHIATLSAENARMREALTPFAGAAGCYTSFDGQHDFLDSDIAFQCGFTKITVGDLRRACEAIALTAPSERPAVSIDATAWGASVAPEVEADRAKGNPSGGNNLREMLDSCKPEKQWEKGRRPGRWADCPSTHCERRQECASPHECSSSTKDRE